MAARVKKPKKPKSPSTAKTKRDFVRRMMRRNETDPIVKLEMIVVSEIFNAIEDLPFLEKVGPPPFKLNNFLWFKTPEGKKYLKLKQLEFNHKIPEYEKPVDTGEKFGDDIMEKKPQTIRQFLNGS